MAEEQKSYVNPNPPPEAVKAGAKLSEEDLKDPASSTEEILNQVVATLTTLDELLSTITDDDRAILALGKIRGAIEKIKSN